MTCNELATLILKNQNSIAFLVGNGIHNYEIGAKGVKDKVNWNELLEKIKKKYDVNSLGKKPQEGITNPEYFDLIELLYIQQELVKEREAFQKSIALYIENTKDLKQQNHNSFEYSYSVKSKDEKIVSDTSFYSENESLIKAQSFINERVFSVHEDFGFPHNKVTTYDQLSFAEKLQHGELRKFYLFKRNLKEYFKDYSLQDWILPFLRFVSKEQIPILTTNYDEALSKKMDLTRHCKIHNLDSQYTFPFETYFSKTEIEYPWREFAIWHINGLTYYPQSIKIGYLDYANMFNEIRNRLYILHGTSEIFALIKDKETLKYTWISIFFYRDLFIWGVGLNEDEYVLRWLLVERAKYNILTHKSLKGWYVHLKDIDSPMTDGKKMFLNTVGIKIIEVNSHDLHEGVWQQIMNKL